MEINNNPPIKLEKDENGLYKHIQFKFTDQSLVDWKAMIPIEFLYINKQYKKELEEKYNKKIEELNIIEDKIEDKYLVSNLAATKYLLWLRGYKEINFEIRTATDTYAAVCCKLLIPGNFESQNQDIIYSDCACATFANTTSFAQNYLLEMASNRALARATRGLLRINIVNQAELNNKDINYSESPEQKTDIYQTFQNALDRKGKTLQDVVNRLEKEEYLGAKDIKTIKDIPEDKIFGLIEKLNKVKDKN